LERVAGEVVGRETTSMGKVAFASFIGTAIEFYDFYIYGTAAALAGLWAFPLFWLIDTGDPFLIALSFSVGMVFFAMLYGPMGAFLSELYGTRLRYSGAAGELQPRRGLRGRLRALDRGPVAGLDRRVVVDLALRPGDGRRELRLHLVALGDPPDGPHGVRSEERRLIAEARESAAG
jgi:hypothetical protein